MTKYNKDYIKVGNLVTLAEDERIRHYATQYIVLQVFKHNNTAMIANYNNSSWGLFSYNRARAATNKISYPYTSLTRPLETLRCVYARDTGKKIRLGNTVLAQWNAYVESFQLDHERARLTRDVEVNKRVKELVRGMSQKKIDLLTDALYLAYDDRAESASFVHKLKHFKEEGKT